MKKKFIIYHNPRCRKSRESLELLQQHCKELTIIDYLNNSPTKNQLKEILVKLGMKAEDLVRKGEALYKEKYKGKSLSEDEWLKILIENPILIERPLVLSGDRAVIGRPPENVLKLF
jgi:arsenate reductase